MLLLSPLPRTAAASPPALGTKRPVCGTWPAARSCAASKVIRTRSGPSPLRRTAAASPPAQRTTRSVCGTCPAARRCAAWKGIRTRSGPSPLRRTAAASPPAQRTTRSVCGTWPAARSCAAWKGIRVLYLLSPLRRTAAASPRAPGTRRSVWWDLVSGKELRRLERHTETISSVAIAPDGRTLASGSGDKTIRLWDLASGKELRRLEGHTGIVTSVAFAPDGRSLASGSGDTTIRLWDLASGKEQALMAGGTRPYGADLDDPRTCRDQQYGFWLSCREEDGVCRRADDGTMLSELDANGLIGPVLPAEAQQPDGRLPTVSFPHSVEATEGTTVPVKFELKNDSAGPLFWLSIRAEPTSAQADAPSVALRAPPTIMRLEPGQSATVEGWLSVSHPYRDPKPQTLTLPLTLEEAGGRRVALDPITVSADAPVPVIEEAHLSKTVAGAQPLLATLVNKGTSPLNGFSTQGQLHDKAQPDHSQDTELGTGSSPSSDPNAPPKLDPKQKTTITFAVQREAKVPGQPELELAVRAIGFPPARVANSRAGHSVGA